MKSIFRQRTGIRAAALAAVLALTGIPLVYLAWAGTSQPKPEPAKLQQMFLEAGQAYDAGRPLDAAKIYRDLLARGYASRELLFNLGNACYKAGQLGDAVLNYRRAWYRAPRDPDIIANLNFAFQSAGAPVPEVPLPVSLLQKLSLSEWIVSGTVAWWLSCGLILAYMFFRAWRTAWLKAICLAVAIAVLSLAGCGVWLDKYRHPEVVVMTSGQKALSGPLTDAVALFTAPAGTLARYKDSRDTWTEVVVNQQTGWLPSSQCAIVANLNTLKLGTYP